jgi:urease accessory protein
MPQALKNYPDEWQARLELNFDSSMSTGERRTRMARVSHVGPLKVQRPFYPGDNETECHVYILHPPGGFVGNDVLDISGSLEDQSHVLLTTPAAGKFYRTREGCLQVQKISWVLQAGASLAWLPQETIYFKGCNASLSSHFDINKDSHLFFCDLGVLGRKASGEVFDRGSIRQEFTLKVDGLPIIRERFLLEAGSAIHKRDWGLANRSVFATAVLYGSQFECLEQRVRDLVESWNDQEGASAGVTLKSGAMIVRFIGPGMLQCKLNFEGLGELLEACSNISWKRPRIWNT